MKKKMLFPPPGLGIVLLALAGTAKAGAAEATAPVTHDVVVVGAGISGLCAALEAGRSGANVAVIDMWSVFGGHAVMSGGLVCLVDTPVQRASNILDSAALAIEDFLRHGEDANPDWVRRYAQDSRREVYDWLGELGVGWARLFPQFPGNSVPRQHEAQGRGIGLVGPIYRECLGLTNITFIWNTKVISLLADSGLIRGVRAVHLRRGTTNEFRARQTILATGGFESNLQLVREFWPQFLSQPAGDAHILLGSGINSLGSGFDLAGGAGASLTNLDHQLFYSTGLIDPRDPTYRRGVNSFNSQSIWVNEQGRRFVREFVGRLPDPKTTVPAVLRQSPPAYWSIFDRKTRPAFFVSGSDWNDTNVIQREIFANPHTAKWVKSADTLEELAQSAGLPAGALVETVRRWNDLIRAGEDADYQRFSRTDTQRPPAIDTSPFFAVQYFPLTRKSMGGVAVDQSCRVLDKRGQTIPGLFAVGELAGVGGINGRAALEGTMLGPGILMGRLAAREAVRGLSAGDTLARGRGSRPRPEGAPASRTSDVEALRAWRSVLSQRIVEPRAGRAHFEKSHRLVLDRQYDCAQCHRENETSPLELTEDTLDRRRLMESCQGCHGGASER